MQIESIDFALSFNNLKSIPFNKYNNDFTFIVNNKRYETNRYVADILSPIIRKYHFQDATFDEFTISTKDRPQYRDSKIDYFQDFLQLVNFCQTPIDIPHRKHYSDYFLKLGNIDEYLRLHPDHFDKLSPNNVIDRLIQITEINDKCAELTNLLNVSDVIRFAAEHFEEIPQKKLRELNEDLLSEIISNESLKLNEEDDLLQIILDLCKKNPNYSFLFEYVNFNSISEKAFENFIDHFNIEFLNATIWHSICLRFSPNESQMNGLHPRYSEEVVQIDFEEGREFTGIMNFLNEKTGGNIHDNGTIEISSNSICNNECLPRNLVDYNSDNYYYSNNDEDAEVCFDFKDKKIQLNCYSIKSYNNFRNEANLRNWVVEVSDDAKDWLIVDQHSDDQTLNDANVVHAFRTSELNDFYRFVRIRQTGQNWQNDFEMIFYYIEFFGKLKIRSI
ncbi:hypothetical protein M9Y10_015922 [Tritrichomonas musculus]|uniref:BACK domain-containing protein n=1 Tax=Tritrichomonas musculus TaxID=1915356 RepID=A0ABR2I5X4_9EUKA